MKKVSKIIKCIIFFIIGIIIFQLLTVIFVPKNLEGITMKKFYGEEKNKIDVLTIGSSTIRSSYSPMDVWDKYGITSYSLGTSNQTIGLSYYMILEALKYQDSKVIVLDFDDVFVEDMENAYRKTLDNMKLDDVKIKALFDSKIYNLSENKLSYMFPLLRYHTRWNELEENDFCNINKNKDYERTIKGNVISFYKDPYKDNNYMKEKGKKEKISEENLYYIDRIVNLCKDRNIKMLWVAVPSSSDWSLEKNRTVEELANKYKIKFVDYNLDSKIKELKIDWNNDTPDKGVHLNSYGAKKISNDIGKILNEEYNLKNHKNDKNYKEWNKQTKKYKKEKEKIKKMNDENNKKIRRN